MVGLGRFELPTSRLSSARSNQLSYRPEVFFPWQPEVGATWTDGRDTKTAARGLCVRMIGIVHVREERANAEFLRKEVIQPQVPLRLPCYDFTPVADLTVDGCLLR